MDSITLADFNTFIDCVDIVPKESTIFGSNIIFAISVGGKKSKTKIYVRMYNSAWLEREGECTESFQWNQINSNFKLSKMYNELI